MNALAAGSSWPRMSCTRKEPPGRSIRCTWRMAAATLAKWCAAIRHVTVSNAPSRKGSASTSPAAKRTLAAPRLRMNSRAARSMGSVRSKATTSRATPAAAGSSGSRSSIHFTACLIGASPAAIAGLPSLAAAGLSLELRLPLLVEVLDARDVLDGGPRRARRAAHRVHERLADLVVRGAGLLRSREASRHSGRAAGGRHRGERHQLHRLRVERAFPVVEAGELLRLCHEAPPSVGVERQGDYSGRRDWPGGGQSNWLLTGFDSRSKWLGRVTTVNIALDRDKPIPLARQIQAHLERLIRERLLAPGMKLPATRELAHSLGVNRGTVAEAYEELVAAGWARPHVGQGTFVTESPGAPGASEPRRTSGGSPSVDGDLAAPAPLAPAPLDWTALLSRSAQIIAAEDERARTLVSAATSNPAVISFAGGMPDSGLFPTDAFRRVLNQVIRDEGASLLQYYPAGRYPPLRRYLSTYLLRFGLHARPEEILIVNGSQQGFDLIARTLIDQGDTVAIEQPTYPRALQVFRSFGAQLAPVPWDAVGPRVEVFERLLERHAPKLFYCQPSAHNPTGLTLLPETGRRLLEVAVRHHVPIVEDGFDGSQLRRPAG